MNVNSDVTGEHAEPGFHPEARYEIKVHVDWAEFEDLTYRVSFGEPDSEGRQSHDLRVLTGDSARDDSAEGDLVLQGQTGETADSGGLRMWAGRVSDPFYIDLSLLGLVNAAMKNGTGVDLSNWHPDSAQNNIAGTTVDSIVLEVPHTFPLLSPGTCIGVWCATKLATDAGGWRQINRAGHPMMWPIFWPDDTDFSDPANARHPSADIEAAGEYAASRVAAVASQSVADAPGYGEAVARELFPDVLPYVVGTPATFGFAEFNGRAMGDNAPEVMLSLVSGKALPSGLDPSVSEKMRQGEFPYVVPA
jgi:hypothetical protein